MKINFRELKVSNLYNNDISSSIKKFLKSGRIVDLDFNEHVEGKLAEVYKTKYSLGVSSGTMALFLALKAIKDKNPKNEIITSPLSWIATLNSITENNCKPVFVDVKSDFNINAELIENKINEKTLAIMPVHFMGKICNLDLIYKIANKYNLYVIEDGAQSFGSNNFNNKVNCKKCIKAVSFNPMKILSCYGEGGALFLENERLFNKIKKLRFLGTNKYGNCVYPCINGKMSTLSYILLNENLKSFPNILLAYMNNAKYYNDNLSTNFKLPIDNDFGHNYHLYTILHKERNSIKQYLDSYDISTRIVCNRLMSENSAYKQFKNKRFPIATKLTSQMLSIPNADHIKCRHREFISKQLNEYFN